MLVPLLIGGYLSSTLLMAATGRAAGARRPDPDLAADGARTPSGPAVTARRQEAALLDQP
ncbi:hypothetical protein [Streptomyces sp. NPDC047000]|uniref:hypothetical protein n=1 Tax=Streptomyces sp. NPDC047000 TaxID=3155474 RepID=UPI00340FB705